MLLKFFLTCNKIGAFTLGGGYAMIPIMEREFVDKNQWMDRQEFMDIMVVAQTTPGIFAVDMASHIGYKLRGVWGGIVGAVGIALPSIIAIMIIAMFFHNIKDNPWVEKFFRGVRPAVVALIAAPCFKMAKTAGITWRTVWIPIVCCLLIAVVTFAICVCGLLLGKTFGTRLAAFKAACEKMQALPLSHGDAGYQFDLIGGYRMQILVWEGDDEFPPNAQVIYSDNFAEGFAAEDRVVAGDILISTIKSQM